MTKLQTETWSWNLFLSEKQRQEEKVKVFIQVQRSGFRESAKVKRLRKIGAEMDPASKKTTRGGVAGCKIEAQARAEWEPTACRRSSSRRERGTARSGWDTRTWCVFGSCYEGPSRDWAWWRLDGWGVGRPRRKEGKWGEGPSLAIIAIVFRICLCIWLSVSIRKVASNHPFCVLIYMDSCIFHIYFILSIVAVKHIPNI